jgi:hypothetical protein
MEDHSQGLPEGTRPGRARRCSASTPASAPAAAPQARRPGRGGSSAKTTCLSSGAGSPARARGPRAARRRRLDRPAIHDGSDGGGRDQRTGTSPVLGRRSFPLISTLHPALAVNRMACRRSCGTGTGADRPSAPSACGRRRRRSPVRGVQVRQGLLEHRGSYRTGPGPLRGGRGRGQPRRQARSSRSSASTSNTQRPRLAGSRRRPRHRPQRSAHGHLVRSRARRCRSAGPGRRRRCVPARLVLAGGGAPGRGSGCGGRASL